ncbi:GNAT family N-acetyltransferase [Actinokineospora inagensis]|uniref:GNAT family N-acetyltransferase n=1 Tax=Actinokineospora inagensis TaxID=103730 RepID=UPI0003F8DABB|nr:GNAT family N-acetyltransferase [Actinokineospora inagensis]
MSDVLVRPIGDGDWGAIAELERSAYAGLGLAEEGVDALRSRAVSPETCFVVECGGVAGYVLALPYPFGRFPDLYVLEDGVFQSSNLHLHDLVVAEDRRGRGLARALLHRLAAASGSYDRVSLVSVAGSVPFWSANGYRPQPGIAVPASYGPDALYMSKAL